MGIDELRHAVRTSLPDEALNRIIAAGGLQPIEAILESMRGSIVGALICALDMKQSGEPYAKLERHAKLGAMASRLADALRSEPVDWDGPWGDDVEALIANCELFADRMAHVTFRPPPVRGKKQNTACDMAILVLADAYRAAGGQTIGDGRFNNFIGALWRELPGHLARELAANEDAMLTRLKGLRSEIRRRERETTLQGGY